MDTVKTTTEPKAKGFRIERRHFDRANIPPPSWLGQRVGTADEVKRLKDSLVFSAQRMVEMRRRNDQLMAINSELRFQLGEMTVRWVDVCSRLTR